MTALTLDLTGIAEQLARIEARQAEILARLDRSTASDKPLLLSLTEAARELACSRQSVSNLAAAGLIERRHVGDKPVFVRASVEAFARGEAAAPPTPIGGRPRPVRTA